MKTKVSSGFTLIELMIVVAIIGIVAAFALPAYRDYVRSSAMAKVLHHFETSHEFVRSAYLGYQTSLSMGRPEASLNIPYSDAEWIAAINTNEADAPGGGEAFVAGAGDATTGAIGVSATGTDLSDAEITLTRPAYGDWAAPLVITITPDDVL